jgi:class 3 adenylate cyclase/tetratricopeptide (TPR) repeat protein
MVTVLFADMVDSTGLAGRIDAERAREVLGRFFEAANEELLALRGQPEKFIGDAVMAVFGLPKVSETDAVRAVRAGLAIRERTRRLGEALGLDAPLEVRVGIESGEAATGVGPAGQLLVTGSVVNAAARLQGAAEPGEVLAGDTTHQLTNGSVSFGGRRDVKAKGFPEALVAYPVRELSTRSGRRTIPIVGRTAELGILRQSFARVIATDRPQLFTLIGEPGIGKTRVADEFLSELAPDVDVLMGRQFHAETATFAPVATIVRDLAGVRDDDPPEKTLRRLREVAEGCCDPSDAARVASRLGLTLGIHEGRREESAFVQEIKSGFLTLIEGLSSRRPVVLVFEDAHTLRPPMLDLIERLTGRATHGPSRALVLAVGRSELLQERPSWGAGAVNHTMLRLEPLGPEEAVDLAREASTGEIADRTAREIAARAGGNPFFIVEITGVLIGQGHGSTLGAAAIPPTVQAVVASRLDGLPPELRELARRVSVFPYSFDVEELAAVTEAGEPELKALVEEEIVVRDEGGMWRFRHETLREVAYASLPKRERVRLHQAIAESLREAGHLSFAADHLERAALASLDLNPSDRSLAEPAADALAGAGDRARRRTESRSALDYYARALTMAGPEDRWGPREARVLAGMGEARYWLGEFRRATEVLDRAVEFGTKLNDAWTLALALRFLGDIATNFDGDLEKAESLLDRSLRAAEEMGEPFAISRTLLFAGWVPWTRHDFDAAQAIWERALDLSRENDDPWGRIRALTALSINRSDQRDHEGAVALIEEARTLAVASDDQFSMAVTAVQRGRLHEEAGEVQQAIPLFDGGIRIFGDLGARWELADALAERGIVYRDAGRLDEAEQDLQRAVRISQEMGERQLASWTWRALAKVAQKRGDRTEAEERFRRAEQEEARRPQ